jgi:hypothetical protein
MRKSRFTEAQTIGALAVRSRRSILWHSLSDIQSFTLNF